MKKQIFIAASFFAATGFLCQLNAQSTNETAVNTTEVSKTRTKSNTSNDRVSTASTSSCVLTVSGADNGCDIVFSNRDAQSGMATGKRMHKPFRYTVSTIDNSVSEVISPRDASSGMASGKTSAKVSMSDFHFTVKSRGKIIPVSVEDGVCTLPTDCPDGECDMSVSWSWGASNSGSSKRCEVIFTATMDKGCCTGTHIKEAKF